MYIEADNSAIFLLDEDNGARKFFARYRGVENLIFDIRQPDETLVNQLPANLMYAVKIQNE